jgi:hypothetical protein
MAGKGKSIAAVAAKALGIEPKYLPERLRNRLNYYVKDSSLKARLLDEPDPLSEAAHRTSRPIRDGNQNFVRNLVILDTLFEDKKIVIGWLNGEEISSEQLQHYFTEWRAKKVLYQALETRLPELGDFFSQANINWSEDVIPYPFREGVFSSVELIADVITADNNPSPYDSALNAVLTHQFGQLGRILEQSPEAFINGEGQWFNLLYQAKRKEYEEYYALLNKY